VQQTAETERRLLSISPGKHKNMHRITYLGVLLMFFFTMYWIYAKTPAPQKIQAPVRTTVSITSEQPQKKLLQDETDPAAEIKKDPSIRAIISDSKNELKESGQIENHGVSTTKFQHFFQNIEVIGSIAALHKGPGGKQVQNQLKHIAVDTTPKITKKEAQTIAKTSTEAKLKILPGKKNKQDHLIYELKINSLHTIWLDAHTGSVIANMKRTGAVNHR
jgi:uncharacterized membrane protein YkoI